jgi:hypothetical protein
MLLIRFFSILTSWVSFLARSGPKAPAVFERKLCPAVASATVERHDTSR